MVLPCFLYLPTLDRRISGSTVFIIAFDKNEVTKLSEKKGGLVIFCLKEAHTCFRNTFNKRVQIKQIKQIKGYKLKGLILNLDICNDSFPKIVVT